MSLTKSTNPETVTQLCSLETVLEFCQYWGYPCQEKSFETSDGYTLTVQRILNHQLHVPGSCIDCVKPKTTILLMHGKKHIDIP